jgi:hypothetical protein
VQPNKGQRHVSTATTCFVVRMKNIRRRTDETKKEMGEKSNVRDCESEVPKFQNMETG